MSSSCCRRLTSWPSSLRSRIAAVTVSISTAFPCLGTGRTGGHVPGRRRLISSRASSTWAYSCMVVVSVFIPLYIGRLRTGTLTGHRRAVLPVLRPGLPFRAHPLVARSVQAISPAPARRGAAGTPATVAACSGGSPRAT
jgi:hypothetical protein